MDYLAEQVNGGKEIKNTQSDKETYNKIINVL